MQFTFSKQNLKNPNIFKIPLWPKAELIRLQWAVSQVVSWSIRCTGGGGSRGGQQGQGMGCCPCRAG